MSLVTEAQTDDVPDGKHVMAMLDSSGDTRLIWDPNNADEVAAARVMFDTLVNDKKHQAYAVKKDGEPGKKVREFDPTAEKLIITPPLVGG